MSDNNKIDIDGVRFKVEADLSKLDQDLKKGEGKAKAGGESLGKAAGKGFDSSLKSDVDKTLKDVQGKAESSGSALSSIFGKIGGAIAGAFALDKVVGFFKDSMKYAAEMQEEMGGVSKAAKEIEEDFDSFGKKGLGVWDSIKLAVGTLLNNIVLGFKSLAVTIADTFGGKSVERIVTLYQRQKDELKGLGDEMSKLSSLNKRTAEEELKLISLKEQLSDRAKKLGLDYDKLVASGKSWVEILKEMQNKSKLNAQAELSEKQNLAIQRFNAIESSEQQQKKLLEQFRANPAAFAATGATEESMRKALLRTQQDKAKEAANVRAIAQQITDVEKQETKKTPESIVNNSAQNRANEARFLDSALRLKTIQQDLEFTLKKAKDELSKGLIDKEEYYRRTNDGKDGGPLGTAREEARQATDYELNSLRAGFAQYIEDRHTATMLAINTEADNARKLSYELLEAERKQAKDNLNEKLKQAKGIEEEIQVVRAEYEAELENAKEDNAKRLSKISQSEAIKTATAYAESFGRTMQAANATTTGIAQLAKAKDIGSGLSAGGSTLSGLAGFKEFAPALGVLGPIGAGIGALGGVFSTIMGDSEAKRAEAARQQAERDAAALKVLQNQEKYQKDLLEFQKAQANLPFKDLQRELRIIDIQAQQKRLSGGTAESVEAERLQRTSTAISGVLKSQSDTFTGGVFFNNSAQSPEALSAALGDVDRYGPSMNLLSTIINDVAATRDTSGEKTGFDFYNQRMDRVRSLSLPPQLKQAALDFIASVAASAFYRTARDNGITTESMASAAESNLTGFSKYGAAIFRTAQGYEGMLGGRGINQSTSAVDSLIGEFTSDASKIENLLGLFERLNQTNIQIQENTKKTADSTTKLVETPTRTASLIDITRGVFRSLGQSITPRLPGPIGLPDGVRESVMAIDIHKSLQERSLNRLEDLVSIQRDSRQFLAIISKALAEGQNPNSDWRIQLEDLYRRVIST